MVWAKTSNSLLLLFSFSHLGFFCEFYVFITSAHFFIGLPILCFNFVNVVILLKSLLLNGMVVKNTDLNQTARLNIGFATSLGKFLNLCTSVSSLENKVSDGIAQKIIETNKFVIINNIEQCLILSKWSLNTSFYNNYCCCHLCCFISKI